MSKSENVAHERQRSRGDASKRSAGVCEDMKSQLSNCSKKMKRKLLIDLMSEENANRMLPAVGASCIVERDEYSNVVKDNGTTQIQDRAPKKSSLHVEACLLAYFRKRMIVFQSKQ